MMAMAHGCLENLGRVDLRRLGAALSLLVLASGTAFGQAAPPTGGTAVQPNMVTNGPPGTLDQTQTRRTVFANGAEVDTTRSFQKSQSYGDANGQLSAHTIIRDSGPKTIVKLPPPNN